MIRWWGRPRYVGVAWWGGWGGPRVVNNVVINRTTTVNVTNINVYRNVNVTNAVVGVPADRFGQGAVRPVRLADAAEARRLTPVRGAVDVRPVRGQRHRERDRRRHAPAGRGPQRGRWWRRARPWTRRRCCASRACPPRRPRPRRSPSSGSCPRPRA